jgi:zinc protease
MWNLNNVLSSFVLTGAINYTAGAFVAEPTAPAADLAHPHPQAVSGVLPNGVRYTIFPHPSHNKESLRLYVEAGSRDEDSIELGAAHFVEHMAFVRPRSFHGQDLSDVFAKAGIAWGRDQNAATTYLGTTYALDIAEVNEDKLDLSFRWLGDVVDGLDFDPALVDQERGVVLQEYYSAQSPAYRAGIQMQAFLEPTLRGTWRLPIGTEGTIKSLKASTLAAFHRRWYRPSSLIVIAVGDEPTDRVKARIEQVFGRLPRDSDRLPHPDDGTVDYQRPTSALGIADPTLPTAVQVCRFTPKDPWRPEGVESHRISLADSIWAMTFALRAQALSRSSSPPFLGATASWAEPYQAVGASCVSAVAINDDWAGALKSVAAEMRRLEAEGVSEKEFDYAAVGWKTRWDRAVANASTATAPAYAQVILNNYLGRGIFNTAEEDRRIQLAALAKLNPNAVRGAFKRRWSEASAPLIVVTGPKPVGAREIEAAWAADQANPVSARPVAEPATKWAYTDFGPPGAVASREEISDPGFVRLKFANGVVVNFKHTAFAKDNVQIRVRFGAGQQELLPGEVWKAAIGAPLLLEGGLERNSAQDLDDICKGKSCNIGLGAGRTSFAIIGSSRTQDLKLELQLLAAFLFEPAFSDSLNARIPSAAHITYRRIDSVPAMVAAIAMNKAMPQPHVADLPSEDEAASLKAEVFRKLFAPILRNDALEVTVVGDVDEATATKLIASTLGALKSREWIDRTRPDAVRVVFPEAPVPPIIAEHSGPREKAFIGLTWPLYSWDQSRLHESETIGILVAVLQDELLATIRKKFGQSYTPGAIFNIERGGDQGALTVGVETSPENLRAVQNEVRDIAAKLVVSGVTAEAVEKVRKPMIAKAAKQRTYNSWWVEALDGSYSKPGYLKNVLDQDRDILSVTPEEVSAEAKRWLSKAPIIVIAKPKTDPSKPGP